MRIVSRYVIFILAVSFARLAPAETWKDASGVDFNSEPRPNRIITLAPALAELVAAATPTAPSRLVGVSDYSNYPEWIKKVRSVGSFQGSNLETVMSLKPDLIVATMDGNSPEQVSRFRKLGFRVLVVRSGNVDEWLESVDWIGKAVGDSEKLGLSKELHEQFKQVEARAETRIKMGKPVPHVLLILGVDPWITIGKKTLLFEAFLRAGLDPRVGITETVQPYPKYSREAIWASHWDAVLIPGSIEDQSLTQRDRDWFKAHHVPILHVSGDELLRPAARFVSGLAKLQESVFSEPSRAK